MVTFSKGTISEVSAAGTFVSDIMSRVRSEWTTIIGELEPILEDTDRRTLNDNWATYEFALAALTMEAQAMQNLLPPDQARRVREHILRALDAPDLDGAGVEAFRSYEAAWRQGVERNELPFDPVVSLLFDRIGLKGAVTLSGARFKDPLLLTALAGALTMPGRAWWKSTLAQYRIVKE